VSAPTLLVSNGADDAVPPSHMQRLYAAIPHADKERHEVAGASHYYLGQPTELAECVEIFSRWAATLEDRS